MPSARSGFRSLGPDEAAIACGLRRQDRPWSYVADFLACSVQAARDAVWEAECLAYQMETERMARICGPARTATFLRQIAAVLDARS